MTNKLSFLAAIIFLCFLVNKGSNFIHNKAKERFDKNAVAAKYQISDIKYLGSKYYRLCFYKADQEVVCKDLNKEEISAIKEIKGQDKYWEGRCLPDTLDCEEIMIFLPKRDVEKLLIN